MYVPPQALGFCKAPTILTVYRHYINKVEVDWLEKSGFVEKGKMD